MMSEETWILPEQAVEYGFATEVDKPDEDDDEPEQSAMRSAMEHLAGPAPRVPVVQVTAPKLDDEALDRIAGHLAQALGMAAAPPEPTPAPEPQPMTFIQRAAQMFAD